MPATSLARAIREHGIRTVLNLRGPNATEDWYRRELAETLEGGAVQVDVPLSSCVWMSRVQLRTLVDVLDRSDYPLLVHCAWGSERTGLTSAIAELLRPDSGLDEAHEQFALRYLYVRLGDGRIMAEFLDQYEQWLVAQGLRHAPAVFRRWVSEGYVPGSPNRENWPYDPSPLVVITRPGAPDRGDAGADRAAGSTDDTVRR